MTEDEVLQREPPLTPSVTPGQHDVTHRVTPAGHLVPHSTRRGWTRAWAGVGGGGGRLAEVGTELSFTGHGISRIAIFFIPGKLQATRSEGGVWVERATAGWSWKALVGGGWAVGGCTGPSRLTPWASGVAWAGVAPETLAAASQTHTYTHKQFFRACVRRGPHTRKL